MRHSTIRLVLALLALPLTASRAAAATSDTTAIDTAAVLAPTRAFVRALNHYVDSMPAGVFTDDVAILDDFAPYSWTGAHAVADWYAGLLGRTPEERATTGTRAIHGHVTVGAPHYLRVSGDSAYFVLSATYTWMDGTTPVRQRGAWTFAERRVSGHWLIAGQGWAIVSGAP